MKCLVCGKEMKMVKDSRTGKLSKYIWHCDCMPKHLNLMIAGKEEKLGGD